MMRGSFFSAIRSRFSNTQTICLFSRVTDNVQTRGYCHIYEPYASGTRGIAETIVQPARISSLPDGSWEAPEGFSFFNIKDAGIGSVLCQPNQWHLAQAEDPLPDMMLHDDIARRWVIGKENVLNGERLRTGAVFRSFRYLIGAPHDLIEQLEESMYGSARWYFAHCAKSHLPYDLKFLKDGYGLEPLGQSVQDQGNLWRKSVELIVYQKRESPELPLENFYAYVDMFYWRKERWVMAVNYQCPLEELQDTKHILDTIREKSVLNQPSPLYRIVYPKLAPLTPFS